MLLYPYVLCARMSTFSTIIDVASRMRVSQYFAGMGVRNSDTHVDLSYVMSPRLFHMSIPNVVDI